MLSTLPAKSTSSRHHNLLHHHHPPQIIMKDPDCSLCWSSSLDEVSDLTCCGPVTNIDTCNTNNINNNNTITTSATLSTNYTKCRTVRLRRSDAKVPLGFSIRGGWEHGIGFYVSDVQPDSLAAKHGLKAGDQIVRINGFPLDRAVHDEVVSLVRMSTTDLTLRVRSLGLVPLKTRGPGEKLTWKRLCVQRRSQSTEASSFVFTRPRSASSSSLTTPSSTVSSDEHLSDDQSSSDGTQSHHSRPIYCSNYNEKHLYIQCHQPGSSLGCSVVNGPVTCPGIFVQHVKEGKLAAKVGLEIGDQIIKVNDVDVGMIGFDGAISLLKSMVNLTLLVRKGVAKHIFECRDHHYGTLNSSCPTYQSSSLSTSSGSCTLLKHHHQSVQSESSGSSAYYSSIPVPPPPPPPNISVNNTPQQQQYYQQHYHHYKTIASASSRSSAQCSTNYCATAASSASSVQIGCDKSRCCCKRQRNAEANTSAGSGLGFRNASMCNLSTAVMYGNNTSTVASSASENGHLESVTSAMANSIRILQEVREKEEKLVEASRKLSEEHQKLCREKEKLEHEKKELNELKEATKCPPKVPKGSLECVSIDSHYSTVSSAPIASLNSSTGTRSTSLSSASTPFSFLEEIKAMGENGGKRNLRPVNSTDSTRTYETHDKGSQDEKNKLRRAPFGLLNTGKDADKKRQHELLMEEFRIAHQRMFGKNNGNKSSVVPNSSPPSTPESADSEKENSRRVSENLHHNNNSNNNTNNTTNHSHLHPHNSTNVKASEKIRTPAPRVTLKPVSPSSSSSPSTTTTSSATPLSSSSSSPSAKNSPPPPPPPAMMMMMMKMSSSTSTSSSSSTLSSSSSSTSSEEVSHMENTRGSRVASSVVANNRITIKVISPKIA